MVKLKFPSRITHIIFDLDGTLLETESVSMKINQILYAKYNKTYSEKIRSIVTGMAKRESISTAMKYAGLDKKLSLDDYIKEFNEMAKTEFPKCKKLPGAMRLVQHFHDQKIPMAICTGSDKFEFALKTRNHREMMQLISTIVLSGDDPAIKHGKPAPDPFLVTMDRFKTKPNKPPNVLVFEDSGNGVRSAIAAGMPVVMIPDLTFMEIPDDIRGKISSILKSLEDFKPENFGLPPFNVENTMKHQ